MEADVEPDILFSASAPAPLNDTPNPPVPPARATDTAAESASILPRESASTVTPPAATSTSSTFLIYAFTSLAMLFSASEIPMLNVTALLPKAALRLAAAASACISALLSALISSVDASILRPSPATFSIYAAVLL